MFTRKLLAAFRRGMTDKTAEKSASKYWGVVKLNGENWRAETSPNPALRLTVQGLNIKEGRLVIKFPTLLFVAQNDDGGAWPSVSKFIVFRVSAVGVR